MRFTLLWPYHLGLRMKLGLQRRLSSEPSFHQVTPHYFIGAWPSEQKLVPTVGGCCLSLSLLGVRLKRLRPGGAACATPASQGMNPTPFPPPPRRCIPRCWM